MEGIQTQIAKYIAFKINLFALLNEEGCVDDYLFFREKPGRGCCHVESFKLILKITSDSGNMYNILITKIKEVSSAYGIIIKLHLLVRETKKHNYKIVSDNQVSLTSSNKNIGK